MDAQQTVTNYLIEAVGGGVCLLTLAVVGLDDESIVAELPEVSLPLMAGGSVLAFGRWLHHQETFPFDAQQRGIIALGHLAGGILFGIIAGWILLIVGLENGFPDEIHTILLNGAAIGTTGGGVLTAIYLRLHSQQRLLQTQTAQLQAQNDRLEKLASVVSHDLRSPLNVAQGRLELAQETDDPEHLAAIDRALSRMETIIADLLMFTRQTQIPDETTLTALDSVAQSAWQTVETPAVTLNVEDSLRVEANEDRLRQAFENLFRNAIQHGGESLTTVRVGVLDAHGFYIEDDGRGIAEADRETVFEWGVTGAATGTGLGLAIIEEIIEAHGWRITVTEGTTGGARFEITGVNTQ